MTKKPDLPKALASQVRRAQKSVLDARDSLRNNVYNWKQAERSVEEYDADPEAFALRYYQGKPIDSYPVQTRISKDREKLDYYSRRYADKVEDLAAAEDDLIRVEREVLAKVTAMRMTPGREDWPAPLKRFSLEKFGREVAMDLDRQRVLYDERRREIQESYEREIAEIDAAYEAEAGPVWERIRNTLNALPAEVREREIALMKIHWDSVVANFRRSFGGS